MTKFRIPYQHRIITETFTAKELFDDICNQAGVEVGSTSFINSNYIILGNAYTNNETCETVLKDLAKLAVGFAKIGRDNKCYIKNLEVSEDYDEIIDGNYYKETFAKTGEYGTVNKVTVGLVDIEGESNFLKDENSINQNGLTEITINNIAFLINEAERLKVLPSMWNALKGLKYLSAEYDYKGFSYLDSGDKIKLLDVKDKEYNSYVLNHTFTYNGNFSGKITSPMSSKVQEKVSQNSNNIKKAFKNVEYKIDKINGEITQVIEEQTDFSSRLTQQEQTVEGITQTVDNIQNFTKVITGMNEIKLPDALDTNILEFVLEAQIMPEAIYPSKTLFPSKKNFPRKGGSAVTIVIKNADKTKITNLHFYIGIPLLDYGEIHDELVIRFDEEIGQCNVIARRKLKKEKENIVILEEPIETILTQTNFILYKGDNFISIENINNWNMTATYIFNNDFNKKYATKAQMQSQLKLAKDEFEVKVSEETNREKIIASINMTPGQIKMEGYTSINGGFAVDEEGNASIANNAVKINKKGIELKDGTSIVNANGLYSNLQYISSGLLGEDFGGQFSPLGIMVDFTNGSSFYKSDLVIDVYIPDNFIISSAILSIIHTPVHWVGYDAITNSDYDVKGSSKNIHVYISKSNYTFTLTQGGGASTPEIYSLSEINGALGESGHSFQNTTYGSVKEKRSSNIAKSLEQGFQKIIIRTTDTANTVKSSSEKTGLAYAVLNITGYLKKI